MRLPAPPDAARWWPAVVPAGSQRAALEALERAQSEAFAADTPVETLVAARAWAIEQAVLVHWNAQGAPLLDTTLVATGGFGRGEMHPRSDVDLLLLVPDEADAARSAAIERFVAALWDDGLKVGHAVRDVAAAAEAARGDITVMSSLLDARWLAGPAAPLAALRVATASDAMWTPDEFAAAKLAEQHARHARYNDTAYNLEPNLKEGPGGLRELQMPLWIAQRQLGLASLEALRDAHMLGAEEYESLVASRRTLWRIRFALHAASRKAEERLLFEHQRELAKRFGLRDEHAANLAVEQFMQGYFRAAMAIERIGERVLQRLDEARAAARGPIVRHALDTDFDEVAGFLDARDPGLFEREPAAVVRAFRMLLEHPRLNGFRSTLLRRLDAVLPGLDEGFRRNPRVNAEFMALLQASGDVPEALTRMSRHGVLGRFLPAFGHVAGRMQYDLFHAYTVDQHTLFVLRNLHRFGDPAAATEFPLAHELHARLRKPELLLLAGLFHDIAKGRGGDHSELGEQDARAFCAQAGLPPADADLVAWLVREHLLMSVTAQKQDIADPAVVHRFAQRVGDRERLDYLYLLTVGDIRGTSPKLWNSWKDRLLADLHEATRYALRRGLAKPVHASERIAETKSVALAALLAAGEDESRVAAAWQEFPDDSFVRYSAEQLAWLTRTLLDAPPGDAPLVAVRESHDGGSSEVFVSARDRDGVFATIAAVLDRLGVNVLEARVVDSRRGRVLDTFRVLDADGSPLRDAERAERLRARLVEELARPELLLGPAQRAPQRLQRQFHVPVRIDFAPAAGGTRTQLALTCADRPGLLAQVAQALRECGLRVHDARIATFGERAEDFFQITDAHDAPLDPAQQDAVRESLLRRVADVPTATIAGTA